MSGIKLMAIMHAADETLKTAGNAMFGLTIGGYGIKEWLLDNSEVISTSMLIMTGSAGTLFYLIGALIKWRRHSHDVKMDLHDRDLDKKPIRK